MDRAGNIYVTDTGNNRIQKFLADGTPASGWPVGSGGTGNGQFDKPTGIALDSAGNIYVTDQNNHRILQFDSAGTFVLTWGFGVNGGSNYEICRAPDSCVGGISGPGTGQFNLPLDIAIDSADNIYVLDSRDGDQRLQKFGPTPHGPQVLNSINWINTFIQSGIGLDRLDNLYLAEWYSVQVFNSAGSRIWFWDPNVGNLTDVVVNSQGNPYVIDSSNQRIFKLPAVVFGLDDAIVDDQDGIDNRITFDNLSPNTYGISEVLPAGWRLAEITCTEGDTNPVTFTTTGFVVDLHGSNEVVCTFVNQKDSSLTIVKQTSPAGSTGFDFALTPPGDTLLVRTIGGAGSAAGKLNDPDYMTLDADDNLYVSDESNNRVQKFDADGNFLFMFGWDVDASNAAQEFEICSVAANCKWGIADDGFAGQLDSPTGIAVDADGNIYVGEEFGTRVQKFDADGNFLRMWGRDVDASNPGISYEICTNPINCQRGGFGSGAGEFDETTGLAIYNAPNPINSILYVAEAWNDRVQLFDLDGNFIAMWGWGVDTGADEYEICTVATGPCQTGSAGSGLGQFNAPHDVAVDSAGNVFVSDQANDRIQKFDSAGNPLLTIGSWGDEPGQFRSLEGLTIGPDDKLYVVDDVNDNLQIFDNNGLFLARYTATNSPLHLPNPENVAVDSRGYVYIIDETLDSIQVMTFPDPSGHPFTLDDGQAFVLSTLVAGDYEITEILPAGWSLTGVDCGSATTQAQANGITLSLQWGEDVVCTFTNQVYGEIRFVKHVVGGTALSEDWRFDITDGPQEIAHNATVSLAPGTYLVSERGPAEYNLTGASGACTLVNGQISLTVTNADSTCTITNTRKVGTITFIKDADGGAADDEDWKFQLKNGPAGARLGGDIRHKELVTLDTGIYTVSEHGPDNYHLKSAEGVCQVVNGKIQLTVTEAGGVCEIDNNRDTGKITFRKEVKSGPAQPSAWTFNLTDGPAGAGLPTGIAHNTTQELDTGSYTLTESGPQDYTLVGASGACQLVDGNLKLAVSKQDGLCTVVNEQTSVRVNEFYGASWVREGQTSGKGSQACTWLSLSHQPSGPVTVTVTPRDGQVSVDKTTITLDASNWNRFDLAQPDNIICVTAVDDAIDDGGTPICKAALATRFGGSVLPNSACGDSLSFVDLAVSASADSRFGAFSVFVGNTPQDLDTNPASLDVLLQDNDSAGIKLTPLHLSVVEGDTASYAVVLTSQPTGPVSVSNGTHTLVFEPATWNVPQSFTLSTVDNAIVDGARQQVITHTVASDDTRYAVLVPTAVTLLILDNDLAGVQIKLIDGQYGQLVVLEGGQTASYTVRLTAQPAADIVVTIQVNAVQLSVSAASLTFTAGNWDQPQTVVVTAVDDLVAEDTLVSLIQHTVTSADPIYNGQLAPTLEALVLDNDAAGISVNPTTFTLGVGSTGSYTVVLTSQPGTPVQLNLLFPTAVLPSGSCPTDPSVATCLVFTPDNWQQPQTVNFIGQQPGSDEIQHTIVTSDPHYLSLLDPVVRVTVQADDPGNPGGNNGGDTPPLDGNGDDDIPDGDGNSEPDPLDPNTPEDGENNGNSDNIGTGQILFLPLIRN